MLLPVGGDQLIDRAAARGGCGGGRRGGVGQVFLDEAVVLVPGLGRAVLAEVDLPAVEDDEAEILRLVAAIGRDLRGASMQSPGDAFLGCIGERKSLSTDRSRETDS